MRRQCWKWPVILPVLTVKQAIRRSYSSVRRRLFGRQEYAAKLVKEQLFYDSCTNVHELPEIFHYWSNKYLLPKHKPFGITDPEQFFFLYCARHCENKEGLVRIVSIGCGNCDMESRMAKRLLEEAHNNFHIVCMDVNPNMLKRGQEFAAQIGVAEHLQFEQNDFNQWRPKNKYDVVIANQSLHHVVELEDLFDTIKRQLEPRGVFLTSDMIGRNGHLRWPEARKALEPFWQELPKTYRYNRLLQRQEDTFQDHDCSVDGFEGIRAQDVLPLLVERFNFELFIPFANLVMVFIDRPFGHNFDAKANWDRDFIDRVHARDEAGILNGELKPTQMIAAMTCEKVETRLVHPRLTPEYCMRLPGLLSSSR